PLEFTHQGATWTVRIDPAKRMSFEESGTSEEYFEELFSTAIAKAEKYGTGLYCGEYGCIYVVSPEDTLKWYRTINSVFRKHDIGRAAWNYKAMDFGLSDDRLSEVHDKLIELL
ncbi:MAG: glycosyl hydrolase family 5, partial [Ruminococcus sp.]|nr:glycosyl hydrolase family 5 [Ruminococcus sp.]